MENLVSAIRRELEVEYNAPTFEEFSFLQDRYPDLVFEQHDGDVVQVVFVVAGPTTPGCVNVDDVRASHIEADVDDELLFRIGDSDAYYGQKLCAALVDAVTVRREQSASEEQAFIDMTRSLEPRAIRPRPFPRPLTAWNLYSERDLHGWAGLILGRSISLSELAKPQLKAAESLLKDLSNRCGVPLGGARISISDGIWHFGTYLLGWSCDEPLGPWSPRDWDTLVDRFREVVDESMWQTLASCLDPSGVSVWREHDASLLIGSRGMNTSASIVQGTLEAAPALGDAAWAMASERGPLVYQPDDVIFSGPKPFVVRGAIVARVQAEETGQLDPADLDPSAPVYLIKNARQLGGLDPSVSAKSLHVHRPAAEYLPPWTYQVPMPEDAKAASELLRASTSGAGDSTVRRGLRAIRGLFGGQNETRDPTLLQQLEAYEVLAEYAEPERPSGYRPPASEADIDRVREIGRPPEALVQLYRWHDGRGDGPAREGLFSGGWFCSVEVGLTNMQINLEVRGDFRPSWYVFGENGSGDAKVIELAEGPNYGRVAFWDHESDNTDLEFERTLQEELDGAFNAIARMEEPQWARWVPPRTTSTSTEIAPDALQWTDPTRVSLGATLLTQRGKAFIPWMWWPSELGNRWLCGPRSMSAEGALSNLSSALRSRPVHNFKYKDHADMLREVFAGDGPRAVSLYFPEFELAPGAPKPG